MIDYGRKARACRPWNLGQQLAAGIAGILDIYTSARLEVVIQDLPRGFYRHYTSLWERQSLWLSNCHLQMSINMGRWITSREWTDWSRHCWLRPVGIWKTKQLYLGKREKVFNVELAGACKALEMSEQLEYKGPITILLDTQTVIARLKDNSTGPEQIWATQTQNIVQRLEAEGCQITIWLTPSHEDILGNEKTGQAAKTAAVKPLGIQVEILV